MKPLKEDRIKAKIIFVFDGYGGEKLHNVVYSGTKSADSVIRKYIEKITIRMC